MVKFKYCPECASLQIKRDISGDYCGFCKFKGEMKEGAPDEVNAYKERLKKKGSGDVLKPVHDSNEREDPLRKAKRELMKQKYSASNDLEIL